MVVRRIGVALLLLVLAGCGRGGSDAPGKVGVTVGSEAVDVGPVQYCLDGERQRYDTSPPILEVSPNSKIRLTVPDDIARRGWSVQVFDEKLKEKLGTVEVDKGKAVLDQINTSDVIPPAFYLVVVEDKGGKCGAWTGAWPVGFIRAGGKLSPTTSPSSAPPAG